MSGGDKERLSCAVNEIGKLNKTQSTQSVSGIISGFEIVSRYKSTTRITSGQCYWVEECVMDFLGTSLEEDMDRESSLSATAPSSSMVRIISHGPIMKMRPIVLFGQQTNNPTKAQEVEERQKMRANVTAVVDALITTK